MNNRPVILIGAGCSQEMADYLCLQGIPVLTTWQGIDRVPENAGVFCGRPGVIGGRAANIIQQKATVLYMFGVRLDNEQVGHRIDNFAPKAKKFVYDIDRAELDKLPADWVVIEKDLSVLSRLPEMRGYSDWLKWCKGLYNHFRFELDGPDTVEDYVDPYYFMRILSHICQEGEIIVPSSSGMQSCALMQAFKVKCGQKILLCNTTGAMGLEPMAIGAAIGTGRRVISVSGDGGFFMNVQELEVVKRLSLPIKYFVFCNGGYGSVTTMQDARFNQRVGSDSASGLTLPHLARMAAVWDLPYHELKDNAQLDRIQAIIDADGPAIIRVNTSLAFKYATKVNSSLKDGIFQVDDMENMYPYLPSEELKRLMNA